MNEEQALEISPQRENEKLDLIKVEDAGEIEEVKQIDELNDAQAEEPLASQDAEEQQATKTQLLDVGAAGEQQADISPKQVDDK